MTIFVGTGMVASSVLSGTVLAFRKKGTKTEFTPGAYLFLSFSYPQPTHSARQSVCVSPSCGLCHQSSHRVGKTGPRDPAPFSPFVFGCPWKSERDAVSSPPLVSTAQSRPKRSWLLLSMWRSVELANEHDPQDLPNSERRPFWFFARSRCIAWPRRLFFRFSV